MFDCFDMGVGSIGCTVKEAVKLYFYHIETARVAKARDEAVEIALLKQLQRG